MLNSLINFKLFIKKFRNLKVKFMQAIIAKLKENKNNIQLKCKELANRVKLKMKFRK